MLVGVSQAMQLVALLAMPKIWSLMFAEPWPLGQFLIWIIVGVLCIFGFRLAQCIHLSVDTAEDD
jgi:hypothetical protein